MQSVQKKHLITHTIFALMFCCTPIHALDTEQSIGAELDIKGADMRAYFEGPPIERARSVRIVVLIHLAETQAQSHDEIAYFSEKLSDNVFIVPTLGLVPAPDQFAQSWLKEIRCDGHQFRWLPDPDSKGNIVISFAKQHSRSCVVAATDGPSTTRFIDLLLSLEKADCLSQQEFINKTFEDFGGVNGTEYLTDVSDVSKFLSDNQKQIC